MLAAADAGAGMIPGSIEAAIAGLKSTGVFRFARVAGSPQHDNRVEIISP